LSQALQKKETHEDVYTVILFTEESTFSKKKEKERLLSFCREHGKDITIFPALINIGKQTPTLNAMASHTGGEIIHSDTHSGFPRKVGGQVHKLRCPLATLVQLELHPGIYRSPPLQQDMYCLATLYNDRKMSYFGETPSSQPLVATLHFLRYGRKHAITKTLNP